ncbi:aspartate/glutamate racemase family protein [Kordiimonas lipolytica]|uniref:aspartate/glutamate racemase family protein n=1 Tax=Kordiimonas lipolytica TaxID=1662421 RepID=UPI001E2FC7CD|nr:aspartate/glutamate racemase family protein [Kordiimonas lipolytica]
MPTTTKFDFLDYVQGAITGMDITLSQSHLEVGTSSVESKFDEALGAANIVKRAVEAEANGADAVVIICMGDPGLWPAREAVSIPVLGPGQTAMHYAAMLGQRFSILPTLDGRQATYIGHARLYGLENSLASVRPAGISVLDIAVNPNTKDRLFACAEKAVFDDGADVLILGCGCFKNLDKEIENHLKQKGQAITVIDAVPLTVLTAAALAKTQLSHSKKAFCSPPVKERPGYEGFAFTESPSK